MSKKVPKFIADQYGSAHAFRSQKRRDVRLMLKTLQSLRCGSAYFPGGSDAIYLIDEQLTALRQNLSVEVWGR